MRAKWREILCISLALVLAAFIALRFYVAAEGWAKPLPPSTYFLDQDGILAQHFTDASIPDSARYRLLFDYFLAGYLEFRTSAGERTFYPGIKGNKGHSVEGLEGFARTAPLFAAWLASGRPPVVADPRSPGSLIDLRKLLRQAVLAGTDPKASAYWGEIADYDQRIVEASDIALLIWLSRDDVWAKFSAGEQRQVADWLRQVESLSVHPNNWMLFKIQVSEALRALGMDADAQGSRATYLNFKKLYLEAGWFSDPPKGVDYYNSWAISYSLFWIDQMNPRFDRAFIRNALRQSGSLVLHLISPEGVPIMGRSQCYRMAIPSPVVMQPILEAPSAEAGQARRALDLVWRYFIQNGGVSQGRASQGYYHSDPRLLDAYSGPGSCRWSLRSLVLAFYQPETSSFWQAPQQPLPIERNSYRINLRRLGWSIRGDRATGEIVIQIPANGNATHVIEKKSQWRGWAERALARPFRPENIEAKYGNGSYSSAIPANTRP